MSKVTVKQRQCSVKDCGNEFLAKGLCRKHYLRMYKNGTLELIRKRNHCKFEGCNDLCFGHGYCNMHYSRVRRHGNPGEYHDSTCHKLSFDDVDGIKAVLLKYRKISKNGCWEWKRTKTRGYGWMSIDGNGYLVHRISAFVFKNFNLLGDMHVLHHCDNRKCFNPDHIYEGTDYDNHLDRINRKRLIWNPHGSGFISGLR